MARYIDADALMEKIRKCEFELTGRGIVYPAGDVQSAIYWQPTADVAPRAEWISVEERLPDRDMERVLVNLSDCSFTKPIGFNKIDTDRYVDGKWVRWGNHVTHWMPLPEPPKGD